MSNHGCPKFLVRGDLSDAELEAAAAWIAERIAEQAALGPVTCPSCGGTDVTGRNGTPPTYTCACAHRWHTPVVLYGEVTR